MSRTLDVYLQTELVGHLTQETSGQITFCYTEDWLKDSRAIPLSHSLPLQKQAFTEKQCRGFFSGVLPEAEQRSIIARNLGISVHNDFALLEKIGGECAGAVTFIPTGQSLVKEEYHYHSLSESELATLLKSLPQRPLLAGEEGVRLSLAGAQDKIAVYWSGEIISIPMAGAPSTHILKPAIERFEGLVWNEALCLNLAKKSGLTTATAEVKRVDNIDYLLIERFDRTLTNHDDYPKRLHQEDFCQALGIAPEIKYQNEGGPSLKQCFELLRAVSSAPVIDLQQLLDAVIFNFLIGNHDAHGKNFSLLYNKGIRLSPFYDLLCTVYYPELSKKMAMKIGGEYESAKIYPRHFERLAEETGLAKLTVKKRVRELAESVMANLKKIEIKHPVAQQVSELIKQRCQNTVERFS